ncbi:MAG: hypothetical protein R2695_04540 [Acidimicrobiales bacterium]
MISTARSVKISSWVMPRAFSAPLRSMIRNISSPITSQRPDLRHIEAGCIAGSRNSCAPMASISSRTIRATFSWTRQPSSGE